MKYRFLERLPVLSLALFIAGIVSVTLAYSLTQTIKQNLRPAKGFTIVTKQTITMTDPKMQAEPQQADHVITVRYQKSDGAWKEVRTSYKTSGRIIREDISFGVPGRGVFQVDTTRKVLTFISQMPGKEVTSYVAETDGRDNPRFLKDEMVKGYKTYVLRYILSNGSYEDEYYAPALDGYPIKTVAVAPYGSSITEMIQIAEGDPNDSVFTSLPDWPANYDLFKDKIQAMENEGKRETAEFMRRELERNIKKP